LSGIWLIGGGDEKPSAKRIFSGFFVLGLLIVAVAGLLSTNQVWLAGARRSLWFRIESWQATAGMIADAPWLGWGPGNFRDLYTAYKLPGSLEEVADPHNMILELWATASTPAMLAMVALLAFFFVEILARPIAPARATTDRLRPGQPIWQVPLGAVAGLPLAWLLGFVFHPLIGPSARPVAILLVAAGLIVMLAGIWQWVERGVLTRTLLAAATAAMLINLSAAGGLGNPGISTGLWLLLAVGLNLVPQAFEGWQPPRLATGARLASGGRPLGRLPMDSVPSAGRRGGRSRSCQDCRTAKRSGWPVACPAGSEPRRPALRRDRPGFGSGSVSRVAALPAPQRSRPAIRAAAAHR
jgi:hypothetical protein